MSVTVTVGLEEDTDLRAQAHVNSRTGEPFGWLAVGEPGVGMFGSATALRRLAEQAASAAAQVEELCQSGDTQAVA